MPWTVDDVDRHKKGLTPKQKQQWVAVANSVLRRCLAAGGVDAECAPKAIRQADSAVEKAVSAQLSSYGITIPAYSPSYRTHLNKKVMVVPVVMMVEGVHNGSFGPIYHSIDELGKFPASWDGIPIMVEHPEQDGVYISANDPQVLEGSAVGRVFHTRVEGKKLVAEAWIEEDRLNSVLPELLTQLNSGKPLEVSLGMYSDTTYKEGEWNGEQYVGVAYNHRPDHLALLPTSKGACSLNDGCGLRANKRQGGSDEEDQLTKRSKERYNGAVGKELIPNKGGKKMDKNVEILVQALKDEGAEKCLEGVSEKLIANLAEFITNKDEDLGKKTEEIQALSDKIKALEAENAGMKKKLDANKDDDKGVTKDEAIEALKEQFSDTEKFMGLLPENVRNQIQYGLEAYESTRTELIANIRKATEVYGEDELKGMEMSQLEKLAKIVKVPVDYSGRGSGRSNSTPSVPEQPMLPFMDDLASNDKSN